MRRCYFWICLLLVLIGPSCSTTDKTGESSHATDAKSIRLCIAPFQAKFSQVLTTESGLSEVYSRKFGMVLEGIFDKNAKFNEKVYQPNFFAVVITNISKKEITLNSYNADLKGYYALSFQLKVEGEIHEIKRIDIKQRLPGLQINPYQLNQIMITLRPDESIIINPNLGRYLWNNSNKSIFNLRNKKDAKIRAVYNLGTINHTEEKYQTIYSDWIELNRIFPNSLVPYNEGKLVF